MEMHHHRTALITGASSGIGEELARLLAAEGWELVLTARREDALAVLASDLSERHGVRVKTIALDLSQPAAWEALEAQTEGAGHPVDLLVNNAGFGRLGPILDETCAEAHGIIALNVSAVADLSLRFGRRMAARGGGEILQVASIAAFQPGPLMTSYYASKAWVLSFSEGLRVELAPHGVHVTTLCPGVTRTGFQARAGVTADRMMARLPTHTAAEVARAGLRGLARRQAIVVPGVWNRTAAWAVRFLPRSWLPTLTYQIQRRRR
jgi:short-subunit dehydrogenase